MAFFPNKPADSDEIRFGAKQIRENFKGVVNDGIVIPKPPLFGNGVPPNSLGANCERYIDSLTGNEYIKTNDAWLLRTNLSGTYTTHQNLIDLSDGIVTAGIVIPKPPLFGEGIPPNSLGANCERYIDSLTGNEYIKNVDTWLLQTNLSGIYATHQDLADLANESAPSTGVEEEVKVKRYVCPMSPSNGITNQGSFYWVDSAGCITVNMRFNSSFGSGMTMNAIHAIHMPAGFRPSTICYAPCFAVNPSWSTAEVKNGFMLVETDGTIYANFPIVCATGADLITGQISYYAAELEEV